MATFYINGTTLANSTAVFTNPTLTICAPDGFYSDGSGISREQTDCVLGPIQACPSCTLICGGPIINETLGPGIFSIQPSVGGEPTDVGAILVNFYPAAIPDGIKVTYDGVEYNALSSVVDGYHRGILLGGYTYVGSDAAVCTPIAGNTYLLDEFQYINSLGFIPSGGPTNITVDSGELSFSSGVAPGKCTIVIPKTTSSPSSLDISIIGVCPETAFSIDIDCPILLTGYPSTLVQTTQIDACSGNETFNAYEARVLLDGGVIENDACTLSFLFSIGADAIYYNAPVNGSLGSPDLYDWVFEDPYGVTTVPDGYYGYGAAKWMQVANGVIIAIGNC